MNSYTHAIFAAQAEPILRPDHPGLYYWGAIAPDIRYIAKMQRSKTHLTSEKILRLFKRYPNERSFLLGYLVHCALDEIDLAAIIAARFPLRLLRKKLRPQLMAVLVEFYFLEHSSTIFLVEARHNEVLESLGIDSRHTLQYASAMNTYLSAPSIDSAVCAFQALDLLGDARIEKYRQAAERLQRNRLLKKYLFHTVKNARLERAAAEKFREVEQRYPQIIQER